MSLEQDAATFLTLAAAHANNGKSSLTRPSGEDLQIVVEKIVSALITAALREALGPDWTRNPYHPDVLGRAESVADTTATLLKTMPLHQAADLAGITMADVKITACQVPELTEYLTPEAIQEHIHREGARVAEAARDPRIIIGRGNGYLVVQHTASTLRIRCTFSATGPGTVDARPYDIPVIGTDHPDTWYSYLGLGIGTRLYRAAGEHLPHIRWITTRTTDATATIRRRLHAENPYRWHDENCPWCKTHLPAGWADSDETLFARHPQTESDDLVIVPHRTSADGSNTRTRRGRRITTVAMGIFAVTGVALLALHGFSPAQRPDSGPSPRAATQTPTARILSPSPLPAQASPPPGFAARPVWGHVVAAWTKTATSHDGSVFTRAPDGTLFRIDPGTGTATWTANGHWDGGWSGPWAVPSDAGEVVVLANTTTAMSWPATGSPDGEPVTMSRADAPVPDDAVASGNAAASGAATVLTTSRGRVALVTTTPAGAGALLLALPQQK